MAAHRKMRMKKNHFSNVCNVGFGSAMNGVYVLGIAYCGYGILNGTISYGTLMAVLQLIGQIQTPFANITGYLPKYYAMTASAERLMEVEDYSADCQEAESKVTKKIGAYQTSFQAIGLRDVTFSYDRNQKTDPVLSHMNLEIKRGEYVALTGPSGCGKSTIMKILLCLYTPCGGERYLILRKLENELKEGLNEGLQEADEDYLNGNSALLTESELTSSQRWLFAYVPQGNHLMSGTIKEIIAFAKKEDMQDADRVNRALEIACAKDFVDELPDGADTRLGEHGLGLSEGQMQRIAIARAIFADNPILMLDEATSALDEATEAKLLKNLRAMTDKMVLIVTHRPAALEICDRVIQLGPLEK